MKIVPDSRPQQKLEASLQILKNHNIKDKIALIGVRGYYKKTFGDPLSNDRRFYDDAIFLVGEEIYASFNANTDPGDFRRSIASLKTGVWLYKVGIHGLSKAKKFQYKALVQADEVTVVRDGMGEETGYFGINIHRGGYSTVSSLGCQTIHPTQWDSFMSLVASSLKRYNLEIIKYCLIENQD